MLNQSVHSGGREESTPNDKRSCVWSQEGDHSPHLWADGTAQVKHLLGTDLVPLPQEENTAGHSFNGNKEEMGEVDRIEKNKQVLHNDYNFRMAFSVSATIVDMKGNGCK